MSSGGILDGLLDLVFPRRCVQCGAAGGWLCEPCAGDLRPLPAQHCPRCGAPGPWAAPRQRHRAGRRCPECGGRDLAFRSAAAAFTYEGPAKALITACKFRALRSLADDMVGRASPAFAAAGANVDLVTWVPGHRDHQMERGFNQAELLGRGFARRAGVPYAPLLRRVRHGARQSGLDRAGRAANVRDAFALREGVNGVTRKLKRVLIVDDVYTTGETLDHCAEVLAQAGLEPHVFTFARTVRATPSQASLDHAVQKERCP
ncbi:MAG: ComF family protein [Actinobacteria bacterium]|nr:ComF family protein [Actinomycetota bacterium]